MKIYSITRRGLASLCLLLPLLAACHRTPDEQQVRQAIADAATAARANDADGVLAFVSDDFIGNEGDLDRHGLRQMLVLRAFRHDDTSVLVGPVSVERRSARLIATFTLTLAGGAPGNSFPDGAGAYDMTTAWRHEGGRWRCYSAKWSRKF